MYGVDQTVLSEDLKVTLQARVKLLPCSESVPEPCLSCGRVDQPERLHTHPHMTREDTGETKREDRHRHKSPLKVREENIHTGYNFYNSQEQKADAKNVIKEKPGNSTDSSQREVIKERPRRGRRSQSPKKSLSPEKSYSPTENSQSSPVVKRRNKNSVKSSEKENQSRGGASSPSSVIEAYASPKKLRIPKQKIVGEGRAKQNNDFTVDIFTSRTNEEREKDRIESVAEHQQVEIRIKI